MAKLIDYDVTGVEESTGGTGVKPPLGVRVCRVVRCKHRTEKRDGSPANDLEVGLDFGPEYDWLFTYVGLSEASDWKLAEFVRAIGLKDKGKLNPDKIESDKPVLRAKLNPGTRDDGAPDVGRLMPAQEGDEELIGKGVSEISSQKTPEAEDEPAAGGGAKEYPDGYEPWREGEERDGEVVASYEDWTDDDLEGEVTDRGLTIPGGRGAKKGKYITALREDDSEVADGGGGYEPPEDGVAADGADDYDSWDLEQLTKEWTDREMGDVPVINGRNAEARLIKKLIEELREDDKANPFEG